MYLSTENGEKDSPFNQANRQYKIREANQSTCPYHPICHPHIYQQKISSLYGKQENRLKPVDHSFDALGEQSHPSLHRCLKNFRTFHSNKRKILKENKNKFSQWPYLTSIWSTSQKLSEGLLLIPVNFSAANSVPKLNL